MGECKLIRLEIENFLRVKGLVVEADGRDVIIRGGNGSGKTSAVDALWLALVGGKAGRKLEEPIHEGAERAEVRVDLGSYRIKTRWTKAGKSIVVTDRTGRQVRNPMEVLAGLISENALDPVRFLEGRPQDQLDQVLAIAGVEAPVGKVREITGEEDLKPRDGESADQWLLRLSADDTGDFFIRRRIAHRAAMDKKAALEEADEDLIRMGGAPTDEEGQGAGELLGRAQDLNEKEEVRRQKWDEARVAAENAESAKRKLGDLRKEVQENHAYVAELERKIRELQEEKTLILGKARVTEERIDKGVGVVKDLEIVAADAKGEAERCEDPREELARVREALRGIESAQKERIKRAHQAETVRRLQEEREAAESEHERLDGILQALRELRKGLLEGVDLGVKGLAVGDGQLILNGHPFAQGSQAERLRVAIGVAVRTAPRLKLLRIDDGEHLDTESRELVFSEARKHGFQVVMTAVSDGELGVEIVDGEEGQRAEGKGQKEGQKAEGKGQGALTVEPELF